MTAQRNRGFTLIELLIAIAIVGILSAIAYPAYTKQVQKGVRKAAQAAMMEIANREQQYFLVNRAYATKTQLETSGYSLPSEVSSKYTWTMTVDNTTTPPTFTITMTPSGSQASDGTLTLDQSGTKSPSSKWTS